MSDGPTVGLRAPAPLLRDLQPLPASPADPVRSPAAARAHAVATVARAATIRAQVARKERFLSPLRFQLYRAAAIHFERQRDALRHELDRRGRVLNEQRLSEGLGDDIDGILNAIFADFKPQFATAMEHAIGSAMQGAVKHRLADFNLEMSFDLAHPGAQLHLKDYCAAAVTGIDETTRKSMKAIIARGEREGKSYAEIARAMVRKFDDFGEVVPQKHLQNRAELIAVHELGQAYESASRQTVDSLLNDGLPIIKYWSNTGDSRVSAGCRANTAAGWIPAEQEFPSGHQHGPRFPGCRCSVCYEIDVTDPAAVLAPKQPVQVAPPELEPPSASTVPGPDAPIQDFGIYPDPSLSPADTALWWKNKAAAVEKEFGDAISTAFLSTAPAGVKAALGIEIPAATPTPNQKIATTFSNPEAFTIEYASNELISHIYGRSAPGQPWCFYENDPRITRSEKKSIEAYKGITYTDINGYCRKRAEWEASTHRKERIPQIVEHIRQIDRAVAKSSVPGGHEVMRGLGTTPTNEVLALEVGETYIDRGFSSFSLASRTAYNFSDMVRRPNGERVNVILRYITQEGEPARYVTSTENEIIYPREKRWKIVAKQEVMVQEPAGTGKIKVLLVDVIADGYGAVKGQVTEI